ncbi:hypothetical protein QZH41_012170 [Actinostola sp. cb2023]|nr:hypothetical protein QZH41_012170 [Actinostola sp. cb2023]
MDGALSWGKLMCARTGKGPGYTQNIIITPYMHIVIYHVPIMLKEYGSLRMFSGQGVEKKNDGFRRYFHRKVNCWDAATNLILVEKRQDELRERRVYKKRAHEY